MEVLLPLVIITIYYVNMFEINISNYIVSYGSFFVLNSKYFKTLPSIRLYDRSTKSNQSSETSIYFVSSVS